MVEVQQSMQNDTKFSEPQILTAPHLIYMYIHKYMPNRDLVGLINISFMFSPGCAIPKLIQYSGPRICCDIVP